jgi:hypothetical protein
MDRPQLWFGDLRIALIDQIAAVAGSILRAAIGDVVLGRGDLDARAWRFNFASA